MVLWISCINQLNTDILIWSVDITLFTDLPQRAASGKFLKVPLLSGSVVNENDIFEVAAELTTPPGIVFPFVTEVVADLQTQVCSSVFSFILRVYLNTSRRLPSLVLLEPMPKIVSTQSYLSGDTSIKVRKSSPFTATFLTRLPPAVFADLSTRPELRSYHQAEIPIVFGTYDTVIPSMKSTADEVNLSKYMQKAWVAFARDPANGLTNYGWPIYNATSISLVQLGGPANSSGLSLGQGSLLDATCSHSDELLSFAIQLSSNFA